VSFGSMRRTPHRTAGAAPIAMPTEAATCRAMIRLDLFAAGRIRAKFAGRYFIDGGHQVLAEFREWSREAFLNHFGWLGVEILLSQPNDCNIV
jgi:hypothetical protein